MEEKKSIKVSLSTVFLIIAIIVIIIMGYYIYVEKSNSAKEIAELEANASNMQNTINNLQGKIDTISNTINSNSQSANSNTSTDIKSNNTSNFSTSNSSENIVEEKQKLTCMGYNIILYSNNEITIEPIFKDLYEILGTTKSISGTEKSYPVTGLSGNIAKMYQGNNGSGVDPITFFIMADGTVQYIQPLSQIIDNNYTIPNSFKVNGKIDNLTNVVDLKTNSNDVIIAITKDGNEIKCWNEWMENM